ncbi:MAG: thiamine phosphate synthase [Rickettsiales bacterium]|nr:thiamine phosphate synthase [Rickettsiales bacterium]
MQREVEYGHPCRLYLISPPQIELDPFAERLKEAFSGGDVGAFQLRLKDTPEAEIFASARVLRDICRESEVAFIINDHADIAAEVAADGVHLGQDDLAEFSVEKARELLGPDSVIGVSCHDSSHLAMTAGEQGADYVAFGAFHPTKSKSPEALAKYGTPSTELLEWWFEYTVLPCVAIGGMTPENCQPMVTAGADFIAAITAIWEHEAGPAEAVKAFNEAIKRGLKERKSEEAA